MKAHGVNIHLLDRLSLKNVIVDLLYLIITVVFHGLQGGLPDQVASLGKYPYVPVLHLTEFELYML